jgi:phospholipase D1/2
VLKDGAMAAGVLHGDTAQGAGSSSMEHERTDYDQDGHTREGFASSVVPTMEEQTLKEGRPRKGSRVGYAQHDVKRDVIQEEKEDDPKSPNGEVNGRPKSALSGQPSTSENGSLPDRPTGSRSRSTLHLDNLAPRPSSEGEGRPSSDLRSTLKRNASAKSNWTVPTNRPAVAAGDFEDPISDAFWKDKWVASAVHNVSDKLATVHSPRLLLTVDADGDISQGVPRHSGRYYQNVEAIQRVCVLP